eukprot:UN34385
MDVVSPHRDRDSYSYYSSPQFTPKTVADIFVYFYLINLIITVIMFWYIMNKWYSDSLEYGSFAFHPFLMTLGFGICSPLASTTWVVIEKKFGWSHASAKIIHSGLHFVALLLGLIGVMDMYKVHEGKIARDEDGNPTQYEHFQSVHSWLGLMVFVLYALQFIVGFYAFYVRP